MQINRIIQATEDGSHTIAIPELSVTYHSRFGAMQESRHVFIKEGVQYFLKSRNTKLHERLNIMEIGFGTGLNALLSLNEAIHLKQKIFYETIEPYAISVEEAKALNYVSIVNQNLEQDFIKLHSCAFDQPVDINRFFLLKKVDDTLQQFISAKKFHIIYFDAFDPTAQPELWTEEIFRKLYRYLYKNGMLITYCSKGSVRRAMLAAGFNVEKIKGPPGKREIIRAVKL